MTNQSFPLRFAFACLATSAFFTPSAMAQAANGSGAAKAIYLENCAACHSEKLTGGIGPSLIDDEWKHGSSEDEITKGITDGFPETEMPGYADILSEEEIRSLVIYMAEERGLAKTKAFEKVEFDPSKVYETQYESFKLEPVFNYKGEIWGIEFMPDGSFLATDREGDLLQVSPNGKSKKVKKAPKVWLHGQGGMLDAKLHPNYTENGWVYLAISASENQGDDSAVGMTRILRGRIKNGCWEDEEIIFQSKPEHETGTAFHFGSRIEFFDDYVFFSVGDRGDQDKAQDLSWPSGKIHRLHDDGRIPEDNPFVDTEGAYASIYSYGHRNPQGMTVGGRDDQLYISEHGPRGGDEINRPEIGKNYGWPVITYGMNYDGTPMTAETSKESMEQPLEYWVPSIASGGITSVSEGVYAGWNGDILVAGMQSEELHRVRIDGSTAQEDEILLKGLGRIRDVTEGANGYVYVVMNEERHGPSVVYRIVPTKQ